MGAIAVKAAPARNFGGPCYEGPSAYFTGFNICPPQAQTVAPFLTYAHTASVVPGDGCPTGTSSVAGMAFYQGNGTYPSSYNGAFFFSDYSRLCMWVMFPGTNGDPDPATKIAFASSASTIASAALATGSSASRGGSAVCSVSILASSASGG